MIKRCSKCGLPKQEGDCCFFSDAEEAFKNEVKSHYFELANGRASKAGLASFIWRKLIDTTNSEKKAWREKQQSLASMGSNYSNKYEPIIEQKTKEIEYQNKLIRRLQGMVPEPDEINQNKEKPVAGCSGCGSTSGCYCK